MNRNRLLTGVLFALVVALLTSSYIVQQESTLNRAALILTIAAVFALPIALPFAAIGPVLAGGLLLLCGLLILEIHFAAPDSNKAEAAVARRSSSNFAPSALRRQMVPISMPRNTSNTRRPLSDPPR